MTQSGDVWTIDLGDFNPDKVIFNNGSGLQTGDLTFVDGATYDKNGPIGAVIPEHTVYFENTDNWSAVYVYMWGGYVNGWPGEQMTLVEDNLYKFVFKCDNVDGQCLIFNNGNGTQTGDIKNFVDGATYLPNGTIKGEGPIDPVDPVFYVRGLNDNWDANDDTRMTDGGNGVYTYSVAALSAGDTFKIACYNWDDGQYSSLNTAMELGTEYDMMSAAGYDTDMALGVNATDVTITFDYNNMKVTVTGTASDPIVAEPKELYLVGTLTGWSLDENYRMEREENVYTYTFTEDLVPNSDFQFKIWDGTWDWSFGAGDVVLDANSKGQELDSWFDGQNFSLYGLNPTGSDAITISGLTIRFTLVEGSDHRGSSIPSIFEFDYSLLTGVENIAADAADVARYYNLQGVEVAEPAAGLYIRVRGAQTDKVYIR